MTDELKVALQTIWAELPQKLVNKAVANFTKRLTGVTWMWLPMMLSPRAPAVTLSVSKSAFPSYHQ